MVVCEDIQLNFKETRKSFLHIFFKDLRDYRQQCDRMKICLFPLLNSCFIMPSSKHLGHLYLELLQNDLIEWQTIQILAIRFFVGLFKIYILSANNIDELKGTSLITPELLHNIMQAFEQRLAYCCTYLYTFQHII